MKQLRHNISANFVGSGWFALLNFAFVPLYIQLLGIEAYGLTGIFSIMLVTLNLLDMGLSPTMNREMARYSAQPDQASEARHLVRTLEVGYWGLAVLIGGAITILAPFIAHQWVQVNKLAPQTVEHAVMIMGIVAACQWPVSFYSGGLQGLQKQVLLNGINMFVAALRFGGAALVLWLVSPTVTAFFAWQIVTSVLQTVLLTMAFWHYLPAGQTPRFQPRLLRRIWRFAGGMGATAILTLVLTQMDKVILSKVLSLEMLGYYTLAGTMAGGLTLLFGPLSAALFPTFTQLVVGGDIVKLTSLYHRSCQLMSVLILPTAVIGAFFSREILFIWTGSSATAESTFRIASLLIVGTALSGLMYLPYALQLANGWTKLAYVTNVIAIAILAPAIVLMTSAYGAIGAASVWVILNSSYFLISIQIMHRRLLPGEQWRWYLEDVGLPLAAALGVAGMGRLLIHSSTWPLWVLFLSLAFISALALGGAALVTPITRNWLKLMFSNRSLAGKHI